MPPSQSVADAAITQSLPTDMATTPDQAAGKTQSHTSEPVRVLKPILRSGPGTVSRLLNRLIQYLPRISNAAESSRKVTWGEISVREFSSPEGEAVAKKMAEKAEYEACQDALYRPENFLCAIGNPGEPKMAYFQDEAGKKGFLSLNPDPSRGFIQEVEAHQIYLFFQDFDELDDFDNKFHATNYTREEVDKLLSEHPGRPGPQEGYYVFVIPFDDDSPESVVSSHRNFFKAVVLDGDATQRVKASITTAYEAMKKAGAPRYRRL